MENNRDTSRKTMKEEQKREIYQVNHFGRVI